VSDADDGVGRAAAAFLRGDLVSAFDLLAAFGPFGVDAWRRAAEANPGRVAFGMPVWVRGGGDGWDAFADALYAVVSLLSGLERMLSEPVVCDPGVVDALGRPEALLLALAGPSPSAEEVRGVLVRSRSALLEALQSRLATAVARRPCPELAPLLDGLATRVRWFSSYLAFRALVPNREWDPDEVREVVRDAVTFLRERRPWPGSWEVRRGGLVTTRETLVGNWFHRGFILRVLDDLGEPVKDEVAALLAEADPNGIRWFGSWRGIPPDADSLGLALDLCARVGSRPSDGWLAPMRASLEKGVSTTWFYQDDEGLTVDPPVVRYAAQSCTAVRLALTLGLLPWGEEALVRANVDALAACWDGRTLAGSWFYGEAWTEYLLLRLARRHPEPVLVDVADAVVARLWREQGDDGGWGGPQATALRLLGLLEGRPASAGGTRRAARYLCRTRRGDGAWNAEPFYRMPGPGSGAGDHWFEGVELTSSLCAGALGALRRL